MDRDYRDRLGEFSGYNIDIRRIALTLEQVEEFGPPPNWAKVTDTRHFIRSRSTVMSVGNWMP